LKWAQRCVAMYRSPMYLDTLAAAYAEAGDFANAVTIQKEAIEKLTNRNELADYKSRLSLYQQGKPYRASQ